MATSTYTYHTDTKTGEITFQEALEDAKEWLKAHDTHHWVYDSKSAQIGKDTFDQLKTNYQAYKLTSEWSAKYKENESIILKIDKAYRDLGQSPTYEIMNKYVIDLPIYHFAEALQEVANEKVYLQEVGDASFKPAGSKTAGNGRKLNSLIPKVLAKAGTGVLRDRHILSAIRLIKKKVPIILGNYDVTPANPGANSVTAPVPDSGIDNGMNADKTVTPTPVTVAPATTDVTPAPTPIASTEKATLTSPETVPPVAYPSHDAALPVGSANSKAEEGGKTDVNSTKAGEVKEAGGTGIDNNGTPEAYEKAAKKEKRKNDFKKLLKSFKALKSAQGSSKSGGGGGEKKSHFSSMGGEGGHESQGEEGEGSGDDSGSSSSDASSVSSESDNEEEWGGDDGGDDYGGGDEE